MTDSPGKPTLQDVARLAGVSTATVSRCLNSPDMVVEQTRTKVMAAVSALGYSPNFGARAMAAKRTHSIGAVIPTMENAIFARGLQAFQEELRAQGYHLLVASSSYRSDLEAAQVNALVSRGAEGVLLIGRDRADTTLEFLRQRSLPAVKAWTFDEDRTIPSVGFDNLSAMRVLAETVIEQGHRSLAMISAQTLENDRARDRIAGVRQAMQRLGLNDQDLVLIETDYTIEAGGDALEQILQGPSQPTAVLCGNDVLAVGAIQRAKSLGVDVPGAISITGFDDIELATIVEPALTTVHVPHRAMGRQAAKQLIHLIEGSGAPRPVELETHIQVRDSLAPPRQA